MTKQKITLSAIAKQANLSIASVSRVLRTPHVTSWATQTRVHQAIKLLDFDAQHVFKPYENLTPTKKILILDNQLFSQSLINRGIENKLKACGYKIFYLRFLYCNQNDIYQIVNYTLNHSFDGILIINDAPYLKKLLQYTYALPPIVLVNHFSLDLPCVYFDHLMIGYQITEYFLNKKHKRIAILLGNDNKVSSEHLVQGYQQALNRANLQTNPDYIIHNCFNYKSGKQAMKTLMESNRPPTAVICADNICLNYTDDKYLTTQNYPSPYSLVQGALRQCYEMKIKIPLQLSLIYFSHDTQKQHNELDMLSAINKPLYSMGKNAVNLLINLLNKNTKPTQMTNQIETETIFRHST